MPFFLENQTKCAICSTLIRRRTEAIALPYIEPENNEDLVQFCRRFVSRSCFDDWEHHSRFVEAARGLKRGMIRSGEYQDVIYFENFLMATRSEGFIVIHDVFSTFEIVFSEDEKLSFANNLSNLLNGEAAMFKISRWKVSRKSDHFLLEEWKDDQLLDEVKLTENRMKAWLTALNDI